MVEFAIVAAPFLALILAVLQIATTFIAQQALETSAEKAVRQLLTGQAQRSSMSQAAFRSLVCSKLPAFLKCANVLIDVRTVGSFASADMSAPSLTFDSGGNVTSRLTFAPGGAGQITIARVMYLWSVQQAPLGFDISTMTGNRRLLSATNVFKTEQF